MLWNKLIGALSNQEIKFIGSSKASSSASSFSVARPSGVSNGDILVLVGVGGDFADNTGNASGPTISGWSTLVSYSAATIGTSAQYKVANNEPATYTVSRNGTGTAVSTVVLLAYRNASDALPAIGSVSAGSSTSTCASITTPANGVLIAVAGMNYGESISTPPSGMTLRDGGTYSGASLFAYDLLPSSSGVSGTKTATWNSSRAATGFLLQIYDKKAELPELIATTTKQNTASGTSLVVDTPAGIQTGDLLIAVMAAGATATWTGDTSWVELGESGNSASLRVAYKIATSSEPATYTFTASASTTLSGAVMLYRNAAVDVFGTFATGANPLAAPSVTATTEYTELLACYARGAGGVTITTPTGMTAVVTDSDATSPSMLIARQVLGDGATGTRSATVGSTSSVAGVLLALKPA